MLRLRYPVIDHPAGAPSGVDPRASPGTGGSARPVRGGARAARRRHPRDDHPDRRRHGRPPRVLAGRRRDHARPPPHPRIAPRPHRVGHRPPGVRAQAADRPPRAVRDAAPDRRGRRVPPTQRVAPRRVRRRPRRHRPLDRRGPRDRARHAPLARADRRRRRGRGAAVGALAGGAQRHRPPPEPAADRPQRQRDVDQPVGRARSRSTCPRSSSRRPGSRASRPTTA